MFRISEHISTSVNFDIEKKNKKTAPQYEIVCMANTDPWIHQRWEQVPRLESVVKISV